MLGLKSYFRETFGQHGDRHDEQEAPREVPHAQLYECADCGTVFIEPTGAGCSRCRTGTLTPIEQTY